MKKFFKYILLDTLLFVICFIFVRGIVKQNEMEFLQWVNKSALIITSTGVIVGIVQLILKLNKKDRLTEHIIQKDGTKTIGYVYTRYDVFYEPYVEVEYYEYKNIFIRSNKLIYEENYGSGDFDPFEGEHTVKYYRYYESDGGYKEVNNE